MRQFHSYGPVNVQYHYYVERTSLVETCLTQLVGLPETGGYYFTVWAPRQRGKTWLMRQMQKQIPQRYQDRFSVVSFSLGRLRGLQFSAGLETDLPVSFQDLLGTTLPGKPEVKTWADFYQLFAKKGGL